LGFATTATSASNTGSYAINGSGLTANNGNYTFVQAAGNTTALIVNPATLTYTATPTTSTYGSTPSVNAGTVTGFVNGDTLVNATTGVLGFATTATSASNTGSYAINGSGLTANNGNYTFVQAPANATALIVNPATITITGTKSFNGSTIFSASSITSVNGLLSGDTLASATASNMNVAANGSNYFTSFTLSNGRNASNYQLASAGYNPITNAATIIRQLITPNYSVLATRSGQSTYMIMSVDLDSVAGMVASAPATLTYSSVTPMNKTDALMLGLTVNSDNYYLASNSLVIPMLVIPSSSTSSSGQYMMITALATQSMGSATGSRSQVSSAGKMVEYDFLYSAVGSSNVRRIIYTLEEAQLIINGLNNQNFMIFYPGDKKSWKVSDSELSLML
jgi:hypothetical protein